MDDITRNTQGDDRTPCHVTGILRYFLPLLCVLLLLMTGVFFFGGSRFGNLDDAIIVLVYAKHFLHSGLFYWNLADGALDGFTSFLDVMVKALGFLVYPEDPILMAWLSTLLLYLAAVLTIFFFGLFLQGRSYSLKQVILAAAGALAAATSTSMVTGGSFLLETPLFVFLFALTILVLYYGSEQRFLAVSIMPLMLIGLALARPEGVVLALFLLFFYVLEQYRKKPLRHLAVTVGIFSLFLAAYFAWRIKTFGYWAPNTYYAKTSSVRLNEISDGFLYVKGFAQRYSLAGYLNLAALLLAPAYFFLGPWRNDKGKRYFTLLSLTGFLSLAMVVWAGGDSYPVGGRFLAIPVVCGLLAQVLAASFLKGGGRFVPLVLLALVSTAQLLPQHASYSNKLKILQSRPPSETTFQHYRFVAESIASVLGEEGDVAQQNLQMFKYFSDKTHLVDMTGLNTRWIAHQEIAERVVWGKAPAGGIAAVNAAVWIHGYRLWDSAPMARYSMRELITMQDKSSNRQLGALFLGNPVEKEAEPLYAPASLQVGRVYFNFFVRRDWAARFRAKGFLVNNRQ